MAERWFVYVMECAEAVKVGLSRNPAGRLKYMAGLASPHDPRLGWLLDHGRNLRWRRMFFLCMCDDRDHAYAVEQYAHHLLRKANIFSEWFRVPAETAALATLQAHNAVRFGRRAPGKPPLRSPLNWEECKAILRADADARDSHCRRFAWSPEMKAYGFSCRRALRRWQTQQAAAAYRATLGEGMWPINWDKPLPTRHGDAMTADQRLAR